MSAVTFSWVSFSTPERWTYFTNFSAFCNPFADTSLAAFCQVAARRSPMTDPPSWIITAGPPDASCTSAMTRRSVRQGGRPGWSEAGEATDEQPSLLEDLLVPSDGGIGQGRPRPARVGQSDRQDVIDSAPG